LTPLQAASSQPKRNLPCKKLLLCVWWGSEGVLYTEFISGRQSFNTIKYCEQLTNLCKEIGKKMSIGQ